MNQLRSSLQNSNPMRYRIGQKENANALRSIRVVRGTLVCRLLVVSEEVGLRYESSPLGFDAQVLMVSGFAVNYVLTKGN